MIRPEDRVVLEPWADAWVNRMSRAYLTEYLRTVERAKLLPTHVVDQRRMLDLFTLEKAFHEVENELTARPHWVELPLGGVLKLLTSELPATRIEQ